MQRLLVIFALTLATANGVVAQTITQNLQIHGFADWGVGHSSGGTYEYGSKRGTANDGTFALVLSATPAPRVAMFTQLGFDGVGHHVTEPKLDIVFAQYQLSDRLKLNVGRVKQPFGEYSEIFDVGTAHNMLMLPHGVYDVSGTMGEVYNGVGFTGGIFSASRWGLLYDGYVGNVAVTTLRPWQDTEERSRLMHEVLGGRTVVETPISELSFGVSAFTGHIEDSHDGTLSERHSVFGAQLDWATTRFGLRSEVTRQQEPDVHETAAYIEGTARFAKNWQLSARWDASRASGIELANAAPALARHTDAAVGLNYWITTGFVLRAEFHDVAGNRFIAPLQAVDLGKRTRVLQFGSQFSF
ncbi:MAG: hypothetical protein ABJB74_06325 [Gemmatimonas sp.]